MNSKPRYTVQQVLDAIAQGHTAAGAARILGCVPTTIRNYANRYPTVAKALDGEREDILDYAELGLRKAVLEGEAWAVAFALKTLGKRRGYVERQEVAGPDGGPVRVTVVEEIVSARPADSDPASSGTSSILAE